MFGIIIVIIFDNVIFCDSHYYFKTVILLLQNLLPYSETITSLFLTSES